MNTSQLEWGQTYKDKDGQARKHYPLHHGQLAVWDSDARFLAAIAGRGAGKTSFAPVWLTREINKQPDGTFICAAPTYKILQSATLPEFFKVVNGTNLEGKFKDQKGVYELATGGIVFCRSMDRPEGVEGIQANAIILDEGGQVNLNSWHILQGRVGKHFGRVLITTTPYLKYRWLTSEFVDRWKNGDPDYFVSTFPSTANPTYPKQEYERAKETLPAWKFDMYYNGVFTKPEGVVYPDLPSCVVDPPRDGLPTGKYYGAIDWGSTTDPVAVLVGLLDSSNVLWIVYEHYCREDILETFHSVREWHNALYRATGQTVTRIWADHRPDCIRALRRFRLSCDSGPSINVRSAIKGAGSIEYGIDLLTHRIKTGKLKIVRGVVKSLIQEADRYRYDVDDDGEGKGKLKGADHALDALRYLITGLDRKRPRF